MKSAESPRAEGLVRLGCYRSAIPCHSDATGLYRAASKYSTVREGVQLANKSHTGVSLAGDTDMGLRRGGIHAARDWRNNALYTGSKTSPNPGIVPLASIAVRILELQ